jgi:hypothetical protein
MLTKKKKRKINNIPGSEKKTSIYFQVDNTKKGKKKKETKIIFD